MVLGFLIVYLDLVAVGFGIGWGFSVVLHFPVLDQKRGRLVQPLGVESEAIDLAAGEVPEVRSDGTLVLSDRRIIPIHFRQFTHGYASTSHAAQGKTVDHGILIMGEKGIKAANLKQAYVSNSRFRQSQTVFTIDKKVAFESTASDSERPLALETMKKVKPKTESRGSEGVQLSGEKATSENNALDWTPVAVKQSLGT